jgi:alcohol dehydrogenase
MMLGSAPFALPLCLGHECVADVLRVGSEVTGVRPGQRVVVPFQISCGACTMCRSGFTSNCTSVPPISMYGFGLAGGHWGGALSDELAVPFADGMLVALPEGVDPAAAASVADNVSDGYRHLGPHLPEALERDPEAEVRIIGARRKRVPSGASVSLYAGLVALALGAKRVRMVEARAHVRAQAESLGIETLTPAEGRGLPTAPLVADVSFEPSGLKAALEATSPDGVCTSSGSLHRAAKVPIALMYGRNVTLHVGRTQARAVIPSVLELMADGRLRPELVTDCLADFDDAPRALHDHARGNATKTIVAQPGL